MVYNRPMWQPREKLTPQQWDKIFDLTAQAYQGMTSELKSMPNWDFSADQEWWVISPRLLDQLPTMGEERGRAISRIASCAAHRSLAEGELDQNYRNVIAQCYFGLQNHDPKVKVSLEVPHHRQLDVAPRFSDDIVGKEVMAAAEKQGLVAPKQGHLYSGGSAHADAVWTHWDLVHSLHPRAKR